MKSILRAGLLAGAALMIAVPAEAQQRSFLDLLFGDEQQEQRMPRVAPTPRAQPGARQQSGAGVFPRAPQAKGPAVMDGGGRPAISAVAPPVVSYPGAHGAGQIVIDTSARALYYTLPGGRAYRYPIAVGRVGFGWTGTQRVSRVASWPDWHPPAEMRQRQPHLPEKMTGGVRNPLGARALYLGNSLYRIHGTNDVRSIGTASSSGCFRMTNNHVMHLSSMAGVGTTVHVMRGLGARRNVAGGTGAGGRG